MGRGNTDWASTVAGTPTEPSSPVSSGWIGAIASAHVGLFAAIYAPLQVLLGKQIMLIAPAAKEATLALTTSSGALISLIACPLFGYLSDGTTSRRWGQRVPWVALGVVLCIAAMASLATASTVLAIVLGWCLMQLGINAVLSCMIAAIPDRVPVNQRARVSGIAASATIIGVFSGTAIGGAVGESFALGYALTALALLLGASLFVLTNRGSQYWPEQRPALRLRELRSLLWVNPCRYPDFSWAWLNRFFLQMAVQLCIVYLLYYLTDGIRYRNPTEGVVIVTAVYGLATLSTALLGGWAADRVGARRPFVLAAGLLVAAAAATLALAPSWPYVLLGAIVLGAGHGGFLAVDLALLTQVLPHADRRGKDLGVINMANSLPQVLAGGIAAFVVVRAGGYPALYGAAALCALLAAASVYLIRGVR